MTRILGTNGDLKRWYTVGPNSILKNLPYHKVTIFNNHSYVSVRQCIANYLSKGYSPDTRSNEKTSGYVHKLIDSHLANIVLETAIKVDVGVDPKDIVVILGVQ